MTITLETASNNSARHRKPFFILIRSNQTPYCLVSKWFILTRRIIYVSFAISSHLNHFFFSTNGCIDRFSTVNKTEKALGKSQCDSWGFVSLLEVNNIMSKANWRKFIINGNVWKLFYLSLNKESRILLLYALYIYIKCAFL